MIYNQFTVFLFIDILRNAKDTVTKIILFFSIILYIRQAFTNFEDGYRDLKAVTFSLCQEVALSKEEDELQVVLKEKPHEPLYVKTSEGECSIPRRVFYDIVHAYRPYWTEIIATFTRLFLIFTVIIVIFVLIQTYQIGDALTDVGETFLTIGTVMLPSLLGMDKSSSHQGLAEQRRDTQILTWLSKITTMGKVSLNRNETTHRVINKC